MALDSKLKKVGVNTLGTEYVIQDDTGIYRAAVADMDFTADALTNTLTVASAHGLITGSIITLITSGALPAGLVINHQYYVNILTVDTFKLSEPETPDTEINLTDVGTGTHSFITGINLGGYGTPNPARSSVGLHLVVRLRKSTGDVAIVVNDYLPTSVALFVMPITEDGWYTSYLYALTLKTGSEDIGIVVLNETTGLVEKNIDGIFTELTDDELLLEVDPGIDSYALDDYIIVNSAKIINKMCLDLTNLHIAYNQDKCELVDLVDKQRDYDYATLLLDGGLLQFCRSNMLLAQKNIEALIERYTESK